MNSILFIIRRYATTDGASNALYGFIQNNPNIKNYLIITRWVLSSQDGINIQEVKSWKDIQKILGSNRFNFIHYFKTAYYDIFNWTIRAEKSLTLTLPIITTVCQRPSTKGLYLSPNEISWSKSIVFIDRSAYHDELISFLPEDKKTQIYFGTNDKIISVTQQLIEKKKKDKPEGNTIVFGRGSTLSKCPPDFIEIFKKIHYRDKQFVIAGIPENTWIEEAVKDESNIKIVALKPFEEWLNICNEFDVFLYQIPLDSHSSIDGTLGQAMLLEKAVVYFGSEAPKERLIDGENALIAEKKEQIPELCDKLANDAELRHRLGKNARKSTIENFNIHSSVEKYNNLYSKVSIVDNLEVKIPLKYYIRFYSSCWKHIVKSILGGSIIERAYFKKRPIK